MPHNTRSSPHFGWLLIYLVFLIGALPMVYDLFDIDRVLDYFVWGIIVIGASSLFRSRKLRLLSGLLISLMLGCRIFLTYYYSKGLHLWFLGFNILFLGSVMFATARHIVGAKTIGRNVIFAAICFYLLAGIGMALIYNIAHLLDPDSFAGEFTESEGDFLVRGHLLTFIYFSFVTMTTLGYGDVLPLSAPTRALSVIQSVAGVFYLGTVLGHLVGLQIHSEVTKDQTKAKGKPR